MSRTYPKSSSRTTSPGRQQNGNGRKAVAARQRASGNRKTSRASAANAQAPAITVDELTISDPDQVRRMMQDSLHSFAVELGVQVATCLLEDEVDRLCGTRSQRALERTAYRHGRQSGFVVVAGQKVAIEKPRVRTLAGSEAELESYSLLQASDAMPAAALGKMVRGVSCRDYEGVVDQARAAFGVRKSSVSRNFVRASSRQLAEFSERRFDAITFAAVFIDGVEFAGATLVCALGLADDGSKHVLGVRQGDTENTEVVKSLLSELRDCGVATDQPTLFVIDGAKALAAGVKRVWGENAVIQRCQIHKRRNVEAHVPKTQHVELRRRMNEAYYSDDYDDALRQLRKTVTWLKTINIDAANSLNEGLAETLTVIRLGVTGDLRRILSNTNTIESVFSRVRQVTGRVKRWRDGNMRHRWCVAGLIRAESGFRRVKGFRQIPNLSEALSRIVLENKTQTQ